MSRVCFTCYLVSSLSSFCYYYWLTLVWDTRAKTQRWRSRTSRTLDKKSRRLNKTPVDGLYIIWKKFQLYINRKKLEINANVLDSLWRHCQGNKKHDKSICFILSRILCEFIFTPAAFCNKIAINCNKFLHTIISWSIHLSGWFPSKLWLTICQMLFCSM